MTESTACPTDPACSTAKETVAADKAAVAADQAMVKTAQAKLTQDQATANQDVNQAAATVANDQATLKNTQIAAAVAVKSAQTTLAQTQAAARQAGDQAAAQLAASQVSLQAAQGEGIGAARNALQQAQAKGQQSNDQGAAQLAASRFARASAEQALASFPQDALLLQLQQDQDQVNAARSVLAVAQHNASKGSIVAPVAGVVDHVNVVAGQSAGPPAVTTTHAIVLETPDAFQLTAPVRDSVITRVVRGAIVQVTPAGSPQTLVGTITDNMCAKADHSQMQMGPTDADCVKACVSAHGATYVLYDGKGNVYELSDQKTPEQFAALLRRAGFSDIAVWQDEAGDFAVYYAE